MAASNYVIPEIAEQRGLGARLSRRVGALWTAMGTALVNRGLPPALLGLRFRRSVHAAQAASAIVDIHAPGVHHADPPRGFAQPDDIPADPGWWGFSFRDVAHRPLAPTRILTVPRARLLAIRAGHAGDFTPAVLGARGNSLILREIRYRPFHCAIANRTPDLDLDDALWIAERVFDNYAHWFTAHLPKLVMLRDNGALSGLVLPAERPAWLDASLRRIGIEPDGLPQLPAPGVLRARRLRLVESDRFRPELLRAAREALQLPAGAPDGRVFISRRHARGRMLLEEAELEPLLVAAGFALVAMERLTFDEQVALMARTGVLFAPHGAGLTNMLFCPPGARICEIADPAYPNPNFYAMAAALGHEYHYITARGVGDRHPLRQDLSVRVEAVRAFLATLP